MSHALIPRATYRLQFHEKFTFRDALDLVPYLDALGISHLYASPFFLSAPGSVHGYDVCDHNQFDPEIGTAEDFAMLSDELKKRGISILVDFVPNHMGITGLQNRWWADVLENGSSSPYANYFDIDWKPLKRELENQVLLPILGDQYGRVLEKGELKIIWNEGSYQVDYYGTRLPLSPVSVTPMLEEAIGTSDLTMEEIGNLLDALDKVFRVTGTASVEERKNFRRRLAELSSEDQPLHESIATGIDKLQADLDRLDALLSQQNYRLSYWKVATEEINYRRFFDVNSLAALRMEEPEVFHDAHRLLLQLVSQGNICGVRIDHIDGLAVPRVYLEKLQRAFGEASGSPDNPMAAWLLVEKILGVSEELPATWPVHGTTGYEFASELTGLQVDSAAEKIITVGYAALTGRRRHFREEVYLGKRLVMQVSMAGEVNALGYLLNRISECNRWYRDFTLNALTMAVREVIAFFPVYRSYLEPGESISEMDRRLVLKAIVLARGHNPGLERTVFEFIRDVLLPPPENPHPVDEQLRTNFVLKFQQCTGPVMAKGVEDTAFYVYNRFIALNEVGSDPEKFGLSVEEFHAGNQQRLEKLPRCLLATSTHDTKRSEDVRARLAVLSEMPREWIRTVRHWQMLNRRHRANVDGELAPDSNEEYLLYQVLLGCWPLEPMDEKARACYIARIQEYMVKALHEAKVNSGWVDPNEPWDTAVQKFIGVILEPNARNRFLGELQKMAETIAFAGMVNSLSQTVLKLTSPGVPDFYQGTEIWDWSLVDPDNRRPVDYALRKQMLTSLESGVSAGDLLKNWRDGRIKLHVIHQLLKLRKTQPEIFDSGDYKPVKVTGKSAKQIVAFLRQKEEQTLLVIAPRLNLHKSAPETNTVWAGTKIEDLDVIGWKNILTGEAVSSVMLEDLLGTFPVAVLTRNCLNLSQA
ncbi:MAG: malto-oligosyltrehalose synthase [Chthoniobacterales bacterium]